MDGDAFRRLAEYALGSTATIYPVTPGLFAPDPTPLGEARIDTLGEQTWQDWSRPPNRALTRAPQADSELAISPRDALNQSISPPEHFDRPPEQFRDDLAIPENRSLHPQTENLLGDRGKTPPSKTPSLQSEKPSEFLSQQDAETADLSSLNRAEELSSVASSPTGQFTEGQAETLAEETPSKPDGLSEDSGTQIVTNRAARNPQPKRQTHSPSPAFGESDLARRENTRSTETSSQTSAKANAQGLARESSQTTVQRPEPQQTVSEPSQPSNIASLSAPRTSLPTTGRSQPPSDTPKNSSPPNHAKEVPLPPEVDRNAEKQTLPSGSKSEEATSFFPPSDGSNSPKQAIAPQSNSSTVQSTQSQPASKAIGGTRSPQPKNRSLEPQETDQSDGASQREQVTKTAAPVSVEPLLVDSSLVGSSSVTDINPDQPSLSEVSGPQSNHPSTDNNRSDDLDEAIQLGPSTPSIDAPHDGTQELSVPTIQSSDRSDSLDRNRQPQSTFLPDRDNGESRSGAPPGTVELQSPDRAAPLSELDSIPDARAEQSSPKQHSGSSPIADRRGDVDNIDRSQKQSSQRSSVSRPSPAALQESSTVVSPKSTAEPPTSTGKKAAQPLQPGLKGVSQTISPETANDSAAVQPARSSPLESAPQTTGTTPPESHRSTEISKIGHRSPSSLASTKQEPSPSPPLMGSSASDRSALHPQSLADAVLESGIPSGLDSSSDTVPPALDGTNAEHSARANLSEHIGTGTGDSSSAVRESVEMPSPRDGTGFPFEKDSHAIASDRSISAEEKVLPSSTLADVDRTGLSQEQPPPLSGISQPSSVLSKESSAVVDPKSSAGQPTAVGEIASPPQQTGLEEIDRTVSPETSNDSTEVHLAQSLPLESALPKTRNPRSELDLPTEIPKIEHLSPRPPAATEQRSVDSPSLMQELESSEADGGNASPSSILPTDNSSFVTPASPQQNRSLSERPISQAPPISATGDRASIGRPLMDSISEAQASVDDISDSQDSVVPDLGQAFVDRPSRRQDTVEPVSLPVSSGQPPDSQTDAEPTSGDRMQPPLNVERISPSNASIQSPLFGQSKQRAPQSTTVETTTSYADQSASPDLIHTSGESPSRQQAAIKTDAVSLSGSASLPESASQSEADALQRDPSSSTTAAAETFAERPPSAQHLNRPATIPQTAARSASDSSSNIHSAKNFPQTTDFGSTDSDGARYSRSDRTETEVNTSIPSSPLPGVQKFEQPDAGATDSGTTTPSQASPSEISVRSISNPNVPTPPEGRSPKADSPSDLPSIAPDPEERLSGAPYSAAPPIGKLQTSSPQASSPQASSPQIGEPKVRRQSVADRTSSKQVTGEQAGLSQPVADRVPPSPSNIPSRPTNQDLQRQPLAPSVAIEPSTVSEPSTVIEPSTATDDSSKMAAFIRQQPDRSPVRQPPQSRSDAQSGTSSQPLSPPNSSDRSASPAAFRVSPPRIPATASTPAHSNHDSGSELDDLVPSPSNGSRFEGDSNQNRSAFSPTLYLAREDGEQASHKASGKANDLELTGQPARDFGSSDFGSTDRKHVQRKSAKQLPIEPSGLAKISRVPKLPHQAQAGEAFEPHSRLPVVEGSRDRAVPAAPLETVTSSRPSQGSQSPFIPLGNTQSNSESISRPLAESPSPAVPNPAVPNPALSNSAVPNPLGDRQALSPSFSQPVDASVGAQSQLFTQPGSAQIGSASGATPTSATSKSPQIDPLSTQASQEGTVSSSSSDLGPTQPPERPHAQSLAQPNVFPQKRRSDDRAALSKKSSAARSSAAKSSAAQRVRVNIGRIKITAPLPPKPRPRFQRPSPSLSLDRYLQRRSGGSS